MPTDFFSGPVKVKNSFLPVPVHPGSCRAERQVAPERFVDGLSQALGQLSPQIRGRLFSGLATVASWNYVADDPSVQH